MSIGTDQTLASSMVLLLGASSQIGVFAIPRLLAAGFRVIAVSRKGRPGAYPEFEHVQWLSEADALKASKNCQYLLSAGPMDLAKKFLLHGRQFKSVCIFSSSSVESKQQSANSAERNQIQGMLKLESELGLVSQDMDFKLVIFRPTLIYGCGLDTNISRLASWVNRFGFMPVNARATGLRQPVHADDLASVAVTALFTSRVLPLVLPVSGGETLSYSDMVARIFAAMEKPVRLLRLPEWFFVLLIKLAGVFRPGTGINGEMVRRQGHDLVFDDQQTRQLLDYSPRPFFPREEDFSLPVHIVKAEHLAKAEHS